MKKHFIEAKLQKSGDKITFIASDETLDRANEVIAVSSWDLTNFMLNPVLLVDHDYMVEKIVGLATNIRIEDRKLLFEPEFHNITELAKTVDQMVKEEILNTVSVGFIPHGPVKDGDTGRNELLEISFVAVPANPSAQRLKGLAEAITDEEKIKIESWKQQAEADEKKNDDTEKVKLEEKVKNLTDVNQELTEEITQVKEGRVISGKNRSLLSDVSSKLKEAAEAVDALLNAAEPEKDGGKGRTTKVDDGVTEPKKVPPHVRRALQSLNKQTNKLLADLE